MKASVFCFSDSGAELAGKLCKMLSLDQACICRGIADDMGRLFTENDSIRDVLLFPLMKNRDAK